MLDGDKDEKSRLLVEIRHAVTCRLEIKARNDCLSAVQRGRFLDEQLRLVLDPFEHATVGELSSLLEHQTRLLEESERASDVGCPGGFGYGKIFHSSSGGFPDGVRSEENFYSKFI